MKTKKRILIVDDERDVLEAISFQLFVHGYEITKALSGQQMLDLLKDYRPDLILVDHMMPGSTGVEAIEKMKQLPRAHDIPVILMSASPEPVNKNVKWNAFLRKPFRIDDVLEVVAANLKMPEVIG